MEKGLVRLTVAWTSQIDRETDRQTNKQTDKQTDRQTEGEIQNTEIKWLHRWT